MKELVCIGVFIDALLDTNFVDKGALFWDVTRPFVIFPIWGIVIVAASLGIDVEASTA